MRQGRRLERRIHDSESKFQTTLSHWLSRGAMLVNSPTLSSVYFFPPLKMPIEQWAEEKRFKAAEKRPEEHVHK